MAVNKCVKYLLFFFNLLFWLSGCLILAVSIYLKVSKNANQITNEALPGIDLMIAIGVIIMVLGFLGCCGAIRENRCMLLLFFIFLLFIFILLVAAGIAGAVSQNKMNDWVDQRLQNLTTVLKQDEQLQKDLQALQTELKCCGLLNGRSDWPPGQLPNSCRCNVTATNTKECSSDGIYTTPCATQVINLMKNNMTIVLGIAFGIALLLIFGMVFAMILYCQIGRKDGATANA